MSIQNVGTNRWRVKAKLGRDPETGKQLYFDKVIKGTHEDAKAAEAEATVFDRAMFSALRLQDWMEGKWLPMVKECQASNTYDYYAGTSKRHIYPRIGDVRLRDIDAATVKAWLQELPESARTASRKTLSAALGCAAEDRLIQCNPFSLLSRTTKRRVGKKRSRVRRAYRTFSDDECRRFLRAVEGTSIEAACIVMLYAGARKEEALALDWEQFDWETSTVPVERAWVVVPSTGKCEMGSPKNDESWRDLELAGYAEDRLYTMSLGQQGPICTGPDGARMNPKRFNELFKAVCELYGLPSDMTVKHLRHTFATQQLKNGTDVATLRDLMGHSSSSTILDRYLMPLKSDKSDAQKRLAARIDPRTEGAGVLR